MSLQRQLKRALLGIGFLTFLMGMSVDEIPQATESTMKETRNTLDPVEAACPNDEGPRFSKSQDADAPEACAEDAPSNYLFNSRTGKHHLPYIDEQGDDPEKMSICVMRSLKQGLPVGDGRYYGTCSSPHDSEPVHRPKPCTNLPLVNLMTTTLNTVSHCLGISSRELFPMINHESRFEPNIAKHGFAGGVAQLTGDGISAVQGANARASIYNRSLIPQKNEWVSLASITDPKCAEVKNAATDRVTKLKNTCERIAIPPNPLRSLVYGGLLYLNNKLEAHRMITEWYDKAGAADFKTPEELEKMQVALARMAYNGGDGGARILFHRFALTHNPKTMTYEKFVSGMSKTSYSCYGKWNALKSGKPIDCSSESTGKSYKNHENAVYLLGIERDVKEIENSCEKNSVNIGTQDAYKLDFSIFQEKNEGAEPKCQAKPVINCSQYPVSYPSRL
jgi:hypothetical protein